MPDLWTITYGRYHHDIAKAFAKMRTKKGAKFLYLYKCYDDSFQQQSREISSTYDEVSFSLPSNMDSDD